MGCLNHAISPSTPFLQCEESAAQSYDEVEVCLREKNCTLIFQ